jgi:hypothetical protein
MSDFRYYYLSASLYVFVILVVIVENDLENKIILGLNLSNILCAKILYILTSNYLKILTYIIC